MNVPKDQKAVNIKYLKIDRKKPHNHDVLFNNELSSIFFNKNKKITPNQCQSFNQSDCVDAKIVINEKTRLGISIYQIVRIAV